MRNQLRLLLRNLMFASDKEAEGGKASYSDNNNTQMTTTIDKESKKRE